MIRGRKRPVGIWWGKEDSEGTQKLQNQDADQDLHQSEKQDLDPTAST